MAICYSHFRNDRPRQFFYTDGIYKHISDPTHAADSVVVMLPRQVVGRMLLLRQILR